MIRNHFYKWQFVYIIKEKIQRHLISRLYLALFKYLWYYLYFVLASSQRDRSNFLFPSVPNCSPNHLIISTSKVAYKNRQSVVKDIRLTEPLPHLFKMRRPTQVRSLKFVSPKNDTISPSMILNTESWYFDAWNVCLSTFYNGCSCMCYEFEGVNWNRSTCRVDGKIRQQV